MGDGFELNLFAFKVDFSAAWSMKAGKNLQQSGLTGAVVAKKPQDFALREMDRGVSECRHLTEGFGDVLRTQNLRAHRPPPAARKWLRRTLINMVMSIAPPKIISKV